MYPVCMIEETRQKIITTPMRIMPFTIIDTFLAGGGPIDVIRRGMENLFDRENVGSKKPRALSK